MEKDEQSNNFELSAEQKEELDKRLSNFQNGIGNTYTWDETMTIAEQALNEIKSLGFRNFHS